MLPPSALRVGAAVLRFPGVRRGEANARPEAAGSAHLTLPGGASLARSASSRHRPGAGAPDPAQVRTRSLRGHLGPGSCPAEAPCDRPWGKGPPPFPFPFLPPRHVSSRMAISLSYFFLWVPCSTLPTPPSPSLWLPCLPLCVQIINVAGPFAGSLRCGWTGALCSVTSRRGPSHAAGRSGGSSRVDGG